MTATAQSPHTRRTSGTMTRLSLGDIIREELAAAGDTPDFDAVAKATINRVDPADVPNILFGLVRQRILSIAHGLRTSSVCARVPMTLPDAGPTRRTARVAWQGLLDIIVCVDERDPGSHKRLGVCTLADVRAVVANRQTKASQFTAEANRYKRIAELMVAQHAATVADLPPATLLGLARGWRS